MKRFSASAARARTATLLVAGFYLLVALWAMRVVLPAPKTLLPIPGSTRASLDSIQVDDWDKQIAVAGIARNARNMLHAPCGRR